MDKTYNKIDRNKHSNSLCRSVGQESACNAGDRGSIPGSGRSPGEGNGSPPDSSVHGILQERIMEWVACSPPGDLPKPGIEPRSLALQVDSLQSEPPGKPSSVLVFPNHSHTQ